jgi:hypothetical protein
VDAGTSALEPGGRAPVALSGTRVFIAAGDRLTVVDARTGVRLATMRPEHELALGNSAANGFGRRAAPPPVVTSLHGATVVLVAYLVARPGRGTTPGSLADELDVINARTTRVLTRVLVPVRGRPGDVAEFPYGSTPAPAARDGAAVLSARGVRPGGAGGEDLVPTATAAVDLSHGTVLWRKRGTTPVAVAGGYGARAGA